MTVEKPNYAELLACEKTTCPVIEYEYPPTGQHLAECHCRGTGLVYLLPDSVRVKCNICLCEDGHKTCDCCWGLGYTVLDPVTGGDTWARELWPLLSRLESLHHAKTSYVTGKARSESWYIVEKIKDYRRLRIEGDTPAALKAAWDALVAAGVLKETP